MGVKTRQGLKRKTKFHLHLGVIVKRLVFPTDADFFFFFIKYRICNAPWEGYGVTE